MGEANKKRKLFTMLSGVVIGLILALFMLVIVCVVFFRKDAGKTEVDQQSAAIATTAPAETQAPVQTEATEPEEAEQDIVVETPVCTLYYPAKWKDNLRTEVEDLGYGYAARFYGTSHGVEKQVFSVWFGEGPETASAVGAIIQNGIQTRVFLEEPVLSEDSSLDKDAENLFLEMQADASYLIGKLKENMFFQAQEIAEEDIVPDISDAVLETPYGTLYYPGEWKDAVSWEITSEGDTCHISVKEAFSGANATAFVLSFNNPEDVGFRMGTLKHDGRDVAVDLTLCDFPQGDLDDSQRTLFLTIQEQAYVMLERFAEDAEYTSILAVG